MVEVRELAQKILDLLRRQAEHREHLSVSITDLYKMFEKEASYDILQQSIRFLADRDLIAPFSYSLTAKGRRTVALERGLKGTSAD
jgi:hypothetical protein